MAAAEGDAAAAATADAQAPTTCTSQVPSLMQEKSPDALVNHPMPENNMAMYIMPGHAKGGPMASIWPLPSVWSRCCTSYSAAEDSTRRDAETAVVSRYNQDTPTGGAANGRDAEWAGAATRTPTNHNLNFPSIKLLPEAHEPAQNFFHAPRTPDNDNNIAVAVGTTKGIYTAAAVVDVVVAQQSQEAYHRPPPLQCDTLDKPAVLIKGEAADSSTVAINKPAMFNDIDSSSKIKAPAVITVQSRIQWAEVLPSSPTVSQWVRPFSYPRECGMVCGGGKQSGYLTAAATCCPGSLVSQTAVLLILLEMLLLLLLLQLIQRVSDRHLLQLQLRSTQAPLH